MVPARNAIEALLHHDRVAGNAFDQQDAGVRERDRLAIAFGYVPDFKHAVFRSWQAGSPERSRLVVFVCRRRYFAQASGTFE